MHSAKYIFDTLLPIRRFPSHYYIEFSIPTVDVLWPMFGAGVLWANSIADAFDMLLLRFLVRLEASFV